MAVSESGAIIGRLLAQGLTGETIGKALGRDRSLVSQVARGVKPGNNLRDSLARLEAQVQGLNDKAARQAVERQTPPAPARRQTARGTLARVRKPATVRGRTYATSTAKRQAARNGARSLGHTITDAADRGRNVAVTVSVDKGLSVNNSSGGKRKRTGAGGSFDMNLGDAEAVWAEVDTMHGGNVAQYLAAQALDRGYISGAADERDAAQHFTGIELRAFE